MRRACLILLTLALLLGAGAAPVCAQNRFLAPGRSFAALSLLRNINTLDPFWGLAGGVSWRGRVAAVVDYRRDGWLGVDGTSYGLEAALISKPDLILEVGLLMTRRPNRLREPTLLPLRLAVPVLRREGFRLLPQATLTWVRDGGGTFLKGDVGLDCVIARRWLLGAELNVNEDWRFRHWTLRAGVLAR